MAGKQVNLKDIVMNLIQLKKQRNALEIDLEIVENQIDQQTNFLENAVVEDALIENTTKKE